MAEFTVEGMDKLIAAMSKANFLDDEETIKEMLQTGGDIIADNIRGEMSASRFHLHNLARKITISRKPKKNKYGDPYTVITVGGKHENGQRNAAIAFVLNYGRSKKYGQIEGGYFWTNGVRKSEKPVQLAMEKIVERKLKERGLI